MQKWYSTLFHLSPPNRRKFSLRKGPWIFRNRRKAPISISLSRLALFRPPPAVRRRWTSYAAGGLRTPPVDFVHRAPAAKWTREVPQRHLARPLALPRAHTHPRRLPEPPQHPPPGAAPLPPPPARRRVAQGQIDCPSRYSPRRGALWPISTPRTPPSRGFSSFLLLPPSAMAGEI